MKHLTILIRYKDEQKMPRVNFANNKAFGGAISSLALYDIFECYDILEKTLKNLKAKASIECECEINEAFEAVNTIIRKK